MKLKKYFLYFIVFDIAQSSTIINIYYLAKWFPNFFKHNFYYLVLESSLSIIIFEIIGLILLAKWLVKKWKPASI